MHSRLMSRRLGRGLAGLIAVACIAAVGCTRQAVVETEPGEMGDPGADLVSQETLEMDLMDFADAQEREFEQEGRYASSLADLGFSPSPGVEIAVLQGDRDGYSAIASAGGLECAIYSGAVRSPRTYVNQPGAVACRS